jgi:hypothetical protein
MYVYVSEEDSNEEEKEINDGNEGKYKINLSDWYLSAYRYKEYINM